MQIEREKIVLEYSHPNGSWTVAVEDSHSLGLSLLSVSDGINSFYIPLLLSPTDVENTIDKMSRIPAGSVSSFNIFSECIAGAASLSIKYGR